MVWFSFRDRQNIEDTKQKVEDLMGAVEGVEAAFTQLTTDVEADAAAGLAELEKLEKELAEKGVTATELAPLKARIEALDGKAKAAKAKIPTT